MALTLLAFTSFLLSPWIVSAYRLSLRALLLRFYFPCVYLGAVALFISVAGAAPTFTQSDTTWFGYVVLVTVFVLGGLAMTKEGGSWK